jgi:hypothetical protein
VRQACEIAAAGLVRGVLYGVPMNRLVFLVATLVAARAHASTCYINSVSTTRDPPLGCPVTIYMQEGSPAPELSARRDGEYVQLTTTATTEETTLDVRYTNYACDGGILDDYVVEGNYTKYTLQLTDAQVGDDLGADIGTVQEAGPCAAEPEPPALYCTGLNSGYPCDPPDDDQPPPPPENDEPDDSAGCQAGAGSSGVWLALVLGAMLGIRRGRPASRPRRRSRPSSSRDPHRARSERSGGS